MFTKNSPTTRRSRCFAQTGVLRQWKGEAGKILSTQVETKCTAAACLQRDSVIASITLNKGMQIRFTLHFLERT